MINKSTYTRVASIINKQLSIYDNSDYKPRVSVADTGKMGDYFDKYSLFTNNELAGLLGRPSSKAQDLFYADETYVVGDDDLYIEPVMNRYFSLAIK